ncbi:MAG: NAD(P)H-hydrate epimerase [Phycisphaera sp. TMED9]|nr:MAG: NAD(P)H-hydrate epimerase [Phycisphaera sp. TMED9]
MIETGEIPPEYDLVLDRAAARRLDAAATERFGIPGIVLMEHAAIGIARLVDQVRLEANLSAVTIICGPGNNGGDGWAVARLLANRGVRVEIVSTGSARAGTDAATNEHIAREMGLPVRSAATLIQAASTTSCSAELAAGPDLADTLVVDAIFGIGLDRPLGGGDPETLVNLLNRSTATVLSVDVPSGLDADRGVPMGACVRADVTATMVAPKLGMSNPESAAWTGRIEVIDIGTPPDLLIEFGTATRIRPIGDDVGDAGPPET